MNESFKNGWILINGKLTPLDDDLFDIPSPLEEEELIANMVQIMKTAIDDEIFISELEKSASLNNN